MRRAGALNGTRALIAGGGPAGAAAAIMLARAGAAPLLIERTRAPHDVVCGGFLGGDALAALARIGVDLAALGARPIATLRLVAGLRAAEAALPFRAAGLSRRTLDAALLRHAELKGARIERGVAIRAAEGTRLRLADSAELDGAALFLATGKHELRGLARDANGAAMGLRARLEPTPALLRGLAGTIELHLLRGGYAGLLVQEDGSVNLCLSIARARLGEAGGDVAALIAALAAEAPRLGERIAAADAAPEWQAIGAVPYGWRARATAPGVFRLGDQAAVIASLAGDGVAIALTSGIAAADAFARDGAEGAAAFQRGFARSAARPLAIAGTLRHLAEGPFGPLLPRLARLPGLAALFARFTRMGAA